MSASREEVLRLQKSFRAVMDALAHPGRPAQIPCARAANAHAFPGMHEALVTVVSLFVDQATTFCMAPGCPHALESAIATETHARCVPVDDAAFVVVPDTADAESLEVAVMRARPGTPLSPERGATVIVGCARIAGEGEDSTGLTLMRASGPGVKGANAFAVDRTEWEHARAWRADEFPCGIDILLVDAQGCVVGVPRTTKVERMEPGEGEPMRGKDKR